MRGLSALKYQKAIMKHVARQTKSMKKRKPKRINPPTLFMIPFISFCCILILLMLLLLVIVKFEGNCFEIIISKQFFCLYVVCIESEDY